MTMRTQPIARAEVEPPALADWINRPSLSLDAHAPAGGVVFLRAPPGYGKTSLMARWSQTAETRGRTSIWITLTAADADPALLLRKITTAVGQSLGVHSAAVPAMLDHGVSPDRFDYPALIANELALLPTPALVCVDNLDAVPDTASIWPLLSRLVGLSHPRCAWVLATRREEDQRFELAEPIGAGVVRTLMVTALALSADEFRAAADRICPDLPAHQVDQAFTVSRGWPTSLHLIEAERRSGATGMQAISKLAAGQGVSGTYLRAALAPIFADPEMAALAYLAAALGSSTAAICAAMRGDDAAGAVFDRMCEAGVYFEPAEDLHGWRRFHPVVENYLRRSMGVNWRRERQAVLHRAALEAEALAYFAEAIRYAMESGDRPVLVALLDRHAGDLWNKGELGLIRAAVSKLTAHDLVGWPKLSFFQILLLSERWHFKDANHMLADIDREARRQSPGTPASIELQTGFAGGLDDTRQICRTVPSYLAAGDPVSLLTDLENWQKTRCSSLNHWDPWMLAVTIWAQGKHLRFAKTALELMQTFEEIELRYAPYGIAWSALLAADCFMLKGDLANARRCHEAAMGLARTNPESGFDVVELIASFGLAWIAYESGALEDAELLFNAIPDDISPQGSADGLIGGLFALSRHCVARHNFERANHLLDRTAMLADVCASEEMAAAVRAERILLASRCADADRVIELGKATLDSGTIARTGERTNRDWLDALASARYHVFLLQWSGVIDALRPWAERLERTNAWRQAAEANLLMSAAFHGLNLGAKAEMHLLKALRISRYGGQERLFLDQAQPVLRAVLSIGGRLVHPDTAQARFWTHLIEQIKTGLDKHGVSAVVELPSSDDQSSSFTPREVQILGLMDMGMSNHNIGERLSLSVGTVKWYVRRIFDKLDVRQRSRAVYRARQLGLLN